MDLSKEALVLRKEALVWVPGNEIWKVIFSRLCEVHIRGDRKCIPQSLASAAHPTNQGVLFVLLPPLLAAPAKNAQRRQK